MTVEITAIETQEERILITANNLENLLFSKDIYEDVEIPEIVFEFNRNAYNGAAVKYLFKLCTCFPKCRKQKNLGAMLDALKGQIVNIPDHFILKKGKRA